MAITRSIDRKLDALQKRIDAERKATPMTKPPTDGLTSTLTPRKVPPTSPKGSP